MSSVTSSAVDVELLVPPAQLVDRPVLGAQQRVVDAGSCSPDLHVLLESDRQAVGELHGGPIGLLLGQSCRRLTITPHCSRKDVDVIG
jgi:hypothetical protein